jgi:S-adenosylmethionine/arginine decarboxylase-like enzyme
LFFISALEGALWQRRFYEMHNTHSQDSISLGWGFYGCGNIAALRDPGLGEKLKEFLLSAGFTVFAHGAHVFPDEGGVSAMAIIGESSADFHAWPEHGTIHVRLFYCQFTCNNDTKAESFLNSCREHFLPERVVEVERNIFPVTYRLSEVTSIRAKRRG